MSKAKAKDLRCYYCRRKAKITVGGHPSCGGDHGTPRALPVVRPMLRNGRASFLRALRGKIDKLPLTNSSGVYEKSARVVKTEILQIVDAAVERYKGA